VAPTVSSSLTNDTGVSNTDGLTSDPTISGSATDDQQLFDLTVSLDGGSAFSVLSSVAGDGTFVLNRTALEIALDATIGDGAHTLHVRATDRIGNASTSDVSFTLDTAGPSQPVYDVQSEELVSPDTTTYRSLLVNGTSDPNSRISFGDSLTITADSSGQFQIPVTLDLGANNITVSATDPAGNVTHFTRTITRVQSSSSDDVILDWDTTAQNAIVQDASAPPIASRAMAMMSGAIYDAVNAVDASSSFLFVKMTAPVGSSDVAAAAQAAHDVLDYVYPAQKATFDAQLATELAAITGGAAKTNGVAAGAGVATTAIIAQRKNDGSTDFVDYQPGTDPGQWQPTYPMYSPALLPQWGNLQPFLMDSPDQFLPDGPPALSSDQWASDYNQVESLGKSDSSTHGGPDANCEILERSGRDDHTDWSLERDRDAGDADAGRV